MSTPQKNTHLDPQSPLTGLVETADGRSTNPKGEDKLPESITALENNLKLKFMHDSGLYLSAGPRFGPLSVLKSG